MAPLSRCATAAGDLSSALRSAWAARLPTGYQVVAAKETALRGAFSKICNEGRGLASYLKTIQVVAAKETALRSVYKRPCNSGKMITSYEYVGLRPPFQKRCLCTLSNGRSGQETMSDVSGIGYLTRLKNTVIEVIKFSTTFPVKLERSLGAFNSKTEAERVAYTAILFSAMCGVTGGIIFLKFYTIDRKARMEMESRITDSITMKIHEELVKCSQSRADSAELVLHMLKTPMSEDMKLVTVITNLLKENERMKIENMFLRSHIDILESLVKRFGAEASYTDATQSEE